MALRGLERRTGTMAATLAAAIALCSGPTMAETQLFYDFEGWEAAIGDYTTIDFTGFENGEVLSDQYADLGVVSPTGNAVIRRQTLAFPTDWWGVSSTFGPGINLAFDTPQRWIAADFPGDIAFRLFSDEVFVEEVRVWGGGAGNFGGIISDVSFDRVEIIDFVDGIVLVDNIYFGVPAPGAIGLLTLTLLVGPRRRRGG